MARVRRGEDDADAHHPHKDGTGFSLTETETALLTGARLAKTAAQHLSLSDITAEIQRLSTDETGQLARKLQKQAKAPAPAIAQALRTFLGRANDTQSLDPLHDGLHYGVMSTSHVSELREDELAALLTANSDALEFLADHPLREALAAPDEFGVSAAVRTAVWSAMVCLKHDGSVAALAWLVAAPPATWNSKQVTVVTETWAAVRQRYPSLPEHPAPIEQLCSTVEEMELSGHFAKPSAGENEDVPEILDGAEDLRDRSGTGDLSERLAELAARTEAQESFYAQVRDLDLLAVVSAMEDGLVPPARELARLQELREHMTGLLAEVAALTSGTVPRSLDEAAQLIQEMSEAIEADSTLERIRLLTGLVAPEYATSEAASIRELANSADANSDPALLSALSAFVDLVQIGASDTRRSFELSAVVQSRIPAAGVLAMLAASGQLSIEAASSPDVAVAEGIGPSGSAEAVADPPQIGISAPASKPTFMMTAAETATQGAVTKAPAPETDLDSLLSGLDFILPEPALGPPDPAPAPATDLSETGEPRTAANQDDGVRERDPMTDTTTLYTTLMSNGQYVLAGWLTDALGFPPSFSAAHRLVAHAIAMRGSAGPNAAAFSDEAKNLEADALAPHVGAQMLVYAAAVRAGLLSPAVGAAAPLRDLTPSVSRAGAAVEELTEALLATFYNGAHLTARSVNAVAAAAGMETQHASLAAAARNLLNTAGSRTIRYQAATELWKLWMGHKGYLGAPLAIVAAGSHTEAQVNFVRERVTEFRSRSTVERAIDKDTPNVMSKRSKKRIEARARDKIIQWVGDVADLLADWIASVDEIDRTAVGGGWMDEPITQLRTKVAAIRGAALAELKALAAGEDGIRSAAVRAGIAELSAALDLVSGDRTVDAGPESLADRVAVGPLILAAGLPFHADPTLRPRRSVVIADVESAAGALADGPAGWTAAFSARSDKGDHVGTYVLVEMLRSIDAVMARKLSSIRERDIEDAVSAIDRKVAELSARIDSDRMFERLTYEEWSDLSTRARAYAADSRGGRLDFDVMRAAVAEVEADREKKSIAAVEAAWERMSSRDLTDEQRGRVSECLERQDLTTANEYLETILTKGELPEDQNNKVDHLKQFFPAFPALFAAAGRGGALLPDLKRAIDAGENPPEGKLAEVLNSSEIDLAAIARNVTAAARIDHWTKLTQARSFDGRQGSVKPILEQLGYIVGETSIPTKASRSPGGRSAWMYLSRVRVTSGSALIPAFGTRMSPSGDTLRLLGVWGAPTPQEIVEHLRSEPVEHSVIVLYFGTLSATQRNEFAETLRRGRKLPPTILVDDPMFAYLSAQPTPGRDITMSVALPFASAEPFTPDVAGLVPEEMFYGRAEELDQVVNMMGSCIVYGGRQLGKSALLRAGARVFNNDTTKYAIYQSIYRCGQATPASGVWPTLWPRLAERGIVPNDMPAADIAGAAARHISNWVAAGQDRQLLLLLDESDSFLDADAKNGAFPNVTAFKDLMENTQRAVKVVFAGLHQTARFERLSNHPLAHLGSPVCVGPLTPQYAYELLTSPLRALGYRFSDDNVAARVLALANNQPALIQLFGAQLLRRLQSAPPAANTPPRTVTAADVETVWADESLRNEFRKRFDWTLNLDPRYKIIAYSVAFHAHANGIESTLSPTELRSQCEQWWPKGFAAKDVLTSEFRALLDECVALGVLSYNSDGNYRLRTPNVLALLGSRDEVDDVLDQAEAQQPPESFDGSLLRPPFGNTNTRSPLTSAQIYDLLGPGSKVRVIVGSPALTVERCAKVLSDRHENATYGNASIIIKETTATALNLTCQQVAQAARAVALVLVDLKNSTHEAAVEAWRQARDQIAGYTAGTLSIILLTSPAHAAMWAQCDRDADQSSGLTELRRYDSVGLRLWLTETALPFQDEASRAELLEATGGWPILVNRVIEDLLAGLPGMTPSDPLEQIRQWLAASANADFLVDACGLRADNVLAQAWSFLVSEVSDDSADPDTLAELLSLAVEVAPALSQQALGAAGYGSTREVVQVLRMLGALVTSPEDGQLRLEPVVAAATRTAVGDTGGAGASQ